MIPLRDTIRPRMTPIVNWLLIGVNIWGFFREITMPPQRLDAFLRIYAFVPARLWSGEYSLAASLVTILTAMFLHAGWLHVGGNMLFLYIFGDNVEDRLGHLRYLVFYLGCGVAGSLTHAYFNPDSRLPSLGASGAISGVLAAYVILYPRARVLTLVPIFLFFTIEIPAVLFIFYWFAIQFFSGALSLRVAPSSGGTAYFAHIGGFLAGIILLFVLRPARPPWSPRARVA